MSWDRGDHGHDESTAVLPAVNDRAAGSEDPKRSDTEYFMTLERVQRVERPLSAARIKELTGRITGSLERCSRSTLMAGLL